MGVCLGCRGLMKVWLRHLQASKWGHEELPTREREWVGVGRGGLWDGQDLNIVTNVPGAETPRPSSQPLVGTGAICSTSKCWGQRLQGAGFPVAGRH